MKDKNIDYKSTGGGSYDGVKGNRFWQDELSWIIINMGEDKAKWLLETAPMELKEAKPYKFWVSIKHKTDCLFSRRMGYVGKLMLGYSVRLRLFGKDII